MADETTEATVKKKSKAIEVHAAKVTRHKGPIVLPDAMTTEQAIEVLQRKASYDNEPVKIHEVVDAFVWDGALALQQAIEEQFGVVLQTVEKSFWGEEPPRLISVETGVNETRQVPWGNFSLPGISGKVATGYTRASDGRVVFQIVAQVRHRDEDAIRALAQRTREIAAKESVYRGKALKMVFTDQNGAEQPIPEIRFVGLPEAPVIFNSELEVAIETNVLTPIRYSDAVRRAGIPLKRGCLLAGPYGTGKTLLASQVAREATLHGWTFVYVTKTEDLPYALRFAQGFQPAVVFAEDVDRAAGTERTDEVNQLLNTLDGINTKAAEIMVILTSNHAESINPAMRRPGRIDIVLHIAPPGPDAVERLIRQYAQGLIHPEVDLTEAGSLLAGQIPAVVREVVERAKLEAIRRSKGDAESLCADDVTVAAEVLLAEQRLFKPKAPEASPVELLGRGIGEKIAKGFNWLHADADGDIEEIVGRMESAVDFE